MRFLRKLKLNKRRLVTVSMIVLVFVMSLGYAALSQYIELDGIAIIDRSWIVKVTSITSSTTGEGIDKSNNYASTTATMNATLPTAESTVTYTITLENQGNLVARLNSIDKIEDENTGITYTISGVSEGETLLKPGKTNVVTVTIKYAEGTTSVGNTDKSLMLTFNYVEDGTESITGGSETGNESVPITINNINLKSGQKVKLVDGSIWYVVKNTGSNEELVTLVSGEYISNSTIMYDTSGSVDYNPNSETNIAYYIDNTYIPSLANTINSSGGDATGLTGRLLTKTECENLLATQVDGNIPDYMTLPTWTMTAMDTSQVYYYINQSGNSTGVITSYSPNVAGYARPVITILKSNILPEKLKTQLLEVDNVVQSDSGIDFSKASTYVTAYKEKRSSSANSTYFSSSSTYYFGSGYTFDAATGKYTLTGTTTSKWSNMSTNYANYPYTCKYTNANSCSTLYSLTGYTSTTYGTAYQYTQEVASIAENGKGLYQTTTDKGTVYYFRGNVENNYVQFGSYQKDDAWYHPGVVEHPSSYSTYEECMASGEAESWDGICVKEGGAKGDPMYWRIVRINEDGTIRLVYAGTSLDIIEGQLVEVDGNSGVYESEINYTNTPRKTRAETWYSNHLESVYGSYIADNSFCNDIEVSRTEDTDYGTNIYYKGYDRVTTYSPTYNCADSNILSVANGKLSKPVGILTVDEVMYAGGVLNKANTNYYLSYLNIATMTPSNYDVNNVSSNLIYSVHNGQISEIYSGLYGTYLLINPVINIKADVGAIGNGTVDSPYVINIK